jgi:hypothetical protein
VNCGFDLGDWGAKLSSRGQVSGDVLVVTMPGTGFSITYEKTEENRLIASSFHARTHPNETRKVTFPKFLSLAWTAANEKARELGWI